MCRSLRTDARLAAALAVLLLPALASAQVDLGPVDECTVSVMNQTVPVAKDGTWRLPNLPTSGGYVRVQLVCKGAFGIERGQSKFFTLTRNRMNAIVSIPFGQIPPRPTSVELLVDDPELTEVGQSVQIVARGVYPDGSEAGLNLPSDGTSWVSTNPQVIAVSETGLATAVTSGVVLITAWNQGASAAALLEARLGQDADEDGLPDDWENAVGLDPENPLDALADSDGDGLTNLQEFEAGSNPFAADSDQDGIGDQEETEVGQDGFATAAALADTDGDGIFDGVEIQVGTDPTDAQSVDLEASLTALVVTPPALSFVIGFMGSDAPRTFVLSGVQVDGRATDLTAHPDAEIEIDDNAIAGFTDSPGELVPTGLGKATLSAALAGLSTLAPIVVSNGAPQPLAIVELPGPAFDVALTETHAWLPASGVGLVVYSLKNPYEPALVGLAPLEEALADVALIGDLALVAGATELHVADATAPAAPTVLGSVALPGTAAGVDAEAGVAYVATSEKLVVVDLADPAAPVIVGEAEAAGLGYVACAGGRCVATSASAVHVFDVSVPAAPLAQGSLATGKSLAGVALLGQHALVGDVGAEMLVVDVAQPKLPVVVGMGSTSEYVVRDLALVGQLAFGADLIRANELPIIDVSKPTDPTFVEIIDFGDAFEETSSDGFGIDVNSTLVAETVSAGTNGAPTRLQIGRHTLAEGAGPEDTSPPKVAVVTPEAFEQHYAGRLLDVTLTAQDNSGVALVWATAGAMVGEGRTTMPYAVQVPLPSEPGFVEVRAHAIDLAGNTSDSAPVVIVTVPQPTTTVTGVVVRADDDQPVAGVTVGLGEGALSSQTDAAGAFALADVGSLDPIELELTPPAGSGLQPRLAGPFEATGDVTDVGVISLAAKGIESLTGAIVSRPVMLDIAAPGAPQIGRLVEDFTTTDDVSPDSTALVLTAPPGIALAGAAGLHGDAGDGSDGALVVADGEELELEPGVYRYSSVAISGKVSAPLGGVTLRVQGDFDLDGVFNAGSGGLTLEIGGAFRLVAAGPPPYGMQARGAIRVVAGLAGPVEHQVQIPIMVLTVADDPPLVQGSGLTLTLHGDAVFASKWEMRGDDLGPDADVEIRVSGDATDLSARSYFPGDMRITVGGDLTNAKLFADEGPEGQAGGLWVRAGGDITGESLYGSGEAGITLLAGGDVIVSDSYGGNSKGASAGGGFRVIAGGDVALDNVYAGNNTGPGPGGDLFLAAGGILSITSAYAGRSDISSKSGDITLIADVLTWPEFGGVFPGHAKYQNGTGDSGDVTVKARLIDLKSGDIGSGDAGVGGSSGAVTVDAELLYMDSAWFYSGDAGSGGASGDVLIRVRDTAHFVEAGAWSGNAVCDHVQKTGDVTVEVGSGVAVHPGAYFETGAADGGCAPGPTGDLVFRAGGPAWLDTTEASFIEPGEGDPSGVLEVLASAPVKLVEPVGAAGPDLTATRTSVLVSEALDTQTDFPEGMAAAATFISQPPGLAADVEWASQAHPEAPLSAWSADIGSLPRRRYLRYRVTFEAAAGRTAVLDRLIVDFTPQGCAGSALECDDGSVCTTDSCGPAGCAFEVTTQCADGDACTSDVCHPVQGCAYGPIDCDDGQLCTVDTCVAGTCEHAPPPFGTCCSLNADCDDGDACTHDTCGSDRVCIHDPVDDPLCCGSVADCPGFLDTECSAAACIGSQCKAEGVSCCPVKSHAFSFDTGPDGFVVVNEPADNGWVHRTDGLSGQAPGAFYFGDPATDDYDFGPATGKLRSPPFLTHSYTKVTFAYFMDVESSTYDDELEVVLHQPGKSEKVLWTAPKDTLGEWLAANFYISGIVQAAVLEFRVTVDGDNNTGQGVYLDDLVISTNCGP